MESLRDRLARRMPIVMDGAMGTMLRAHDPDGTACPEVVNLTRPDVLVEIARAFCESGAEIVQTNTFGGSALRLAEFGLEDRSEEINRVAVEAAREGAGEAAWVTGSCGPCGRMLEPYGDLARALLRDSLERQLSAMSAAGVDAVTVETMMDVEEACLAVRLAREVAPDAAVLASMTWRRTPDGFFTHFGTPLAEAVARLEAEGAEAVGANCGAGMAEALDLATALREATSTPILIRPNAGLPETVEGEPVWPATPEEFAEGARALLETGVTLLGGCCGTTPDHIRAIRRAVDGWGRPPLG